MMVIAAASDPTAGSTLNLRRQSSFNANRNNTTKANWLIRLPVLCGNESSLPEAATFVAKH
jgi:hypothetical protein